MIKYQTEANLSAIEFKQVLEESSLGERRPIDEMHRLEKMGSLFFTNSLKLED